MRSDSALRCLAATALVCLAAACHAGEKTRRIELFICAVGEPRRTPRGEAVSDIDSLTASREVVEEMPFDLYAVRSRGLLGGAAGAAREKLNKAAGMLPGKLLLGTLPVGNEGWESSQNIPFMQRRFGLAGDGFARLTRDQWFDTLRGVKVPAMALSMAHMNRSGAPTPEKMAAYAKAFAEFCRSEDRRCFIWLSVEMFRRGDDTARAVYEATRGLVEKYVWMDVPPMVARKEKTLNGLLDEITSVMPADKLVMQYNHNRRLSTSTPEGVSDYIDACNGKGVTSFCVLAPLQAFSEPPWKEFYGAIRSERRAR